MGRSLSRSRSLSQSLFPSVSLARSPCAPKLFSFKVTRLVPGSLSLCLTLQFPCSQNLVTISSPSILFSPCRMLQNSRDLPFRHHPLQVLPRAWEHCARLDRMHLLVKAARETDIGSVGIGGRGIEEGGGKRDSRGGTEKWRGIKRSLLNFCASEYIYHLSF